MFPTMYYFGILVVTLFAVVLARPPKRDSTVNSPPTTEDSVSDLSDVCFFGKYPSTSCKQKCIDLNAEPFCNQETMTCECKPREEEEGNGPSFFDVFFNYLYYVSVNESETEECTSTTTESPDTHRKESYHHDEMVSTDTQTTGYSKDSEAETDDDDDDGYILFYIFDFSSLFECANGTSTTDTDTVTPEGGKPTTRHGTSHGDEISGWAFQHTLALLIIVLLCVLIVFEFYACLKKRKGKMYMETIFKPTTVSSKE